MKIFSIAILLIFLSVIIGTIAHYLLFHSKKNRVKDASLSLAPTQTKKIRDYDIGDKNKAIEDYYIAIEKYEELIHNFKYERYVVEEYESVYLIADTFIVYIGVNSWNGDLGHQRYHVLIEELTYNSLFKFNATQFGKNFRNSFYDIRVNRFYSLENKYIFEKIGATVFFDINKKLPNIQLLDRVKNWEGVPCHFIIVELYDDKGSAATIKYITNEKLEQEAQSFCRQIENFQLYREPHNKITNIELLNKLQQVRKDFIAEKGMDSNALWTLRGHLRYFFISEKTTDFDLQSRGAHLLSNYNNGLFDNIEWIDYGRFEGKWKSEFLVYEYCQKIYGTDNVLFQYSPAFLGHMSYDVFIIPKKTAIEYQGKQHFEPIDFFGGQEHFDKQVERDKKKKILSEQNHVKLIYINYTDTITEKLIRDKVENA